MNEPRLECLDCISAASGDHHGFTGGCIECCARAASRSPHFARVREAGRLDQRYRALLEHFALSHEEVKAAHAADALSRGVRSPDTSAGGQATTTG